MTLSAFNPCPLCLLLKEGEQGAKVSPLEDLWREEEEECMGQEGGAEACMAMELAMVHLVAMVEDLSDVYNIKRQFLTQVL